MQLDLPKDKLLKDTNHILKYFFLKITKKKYKEANEINSSVNITNHIYLYQTSQNN